MLTPQDDLFGHVTSDTRDASVGAEPMGDVAPAIFTERFWYMGATVPTSDIVFNIGMACYPHRGVLDGYAGVSIAGVQHDFRASRHAGDAPLDSRIGPLHIEVLEGLATHRIRLEPNDSSIALDLTFSGRTAPNEEGKEVIRVKGRVLSDLNRFVQMGRYAGWIEVAGQRHQVDEAHCWGARDRSWGLRIEARSDESTPPVTAFSPMLWAFVCAQFEDRAVHFFLKERAPGAHRFLGGSETAAIGADAPARTIVQVDHDLQWEPGPHSQVLAGGEFRLQFEDGRQSTLEMRALPNRYHLKGGLYGGLQGWFQGDDRGPLHTDHGTWNLADPAHRRLLRTVADQPMEFRCDGVVGYGTVQAGVSAGYARYGSVQHLPPL